MIAHGALYAVLSAVLFGASTPASKWLLEALPPFQLAGLLYLGAALATAPVHLRESRSTPPGRLDRANRGRLLGAVLTGGLAGPVLLLFGLSLAGASSVSLLLNLEVAATAALGVLLFGEHLGRVGWAGIAGVILAGVLVSFEGGWPGLGAAALVGAACLCWGLDNHLTAGIDGMSPARSTFWKGLGAGATNLAIGLVRDPLHASASELGAALAVGALSYGASIALYIRAAHQLGATRAQAYFASAPFLGAALAFGALGEPVTWQHLAGGALLAGSIALLFAGRHEHLHAHPALEHVHVHRHDDGHHLHPHPGLPASTRHSHWHRHEPLAHSHPHWPDLHHRHAHAARESPSKDR
jgi:drug/metabolite transporter (DMT)-like permease